MEYATVDLVKIALAALFSLFLLMRTLRGGGPARDPGERRGPGPRPGRLLLVALAVLATANFHHFGFFHSRYLDYGWLDRRAFLHLWELYHYYNGAKYFDELGYRDLYNATIAADAEDGGRLAGISRIRNLGGAGFLSRDQVLLLAPACKARFSPRRWQEFKHDVRYFTQRLPAAALARIMVDHGYNPTPAWNTTGSFLANHVPVERIFALALIDSALLIAAAVALGVSFGCETALVATVFFGINAFSSFAYVGGSFLRYDWLLGLVLALCLFHRRRYVGAGACLSYAAMARLFPALFLFGLVVRAVHETARRRALPPRYARVFLSFLLVSALLFGYGCLNRRGPDSWRQFAAKIGAHHRALTANSIGFAMVLLHDANWDDPVSFAMAYGSSGEDAESTLNRIKGAEAGRRRAAALCVSLSVLALCALAVLGRSDEESFAWGAVPVFMFLTLSNYYYVFLVVGAAVWYRGDGRRPVPLLLLSALQMIVAGIELGVAYPLRAAALSSLAFFLFVLGLICCELLANTNRIRNRVAGPARRTSAAG